MNSGALRAILAGAPRSENFGCGGVENSEFPGASSIAIFVLRTPKKTDMLRALRSVLRAELRRSPGLSKWVSRDVFLRYFDGFWRGFLVT